LEAGYSTTLTGPAATLFTKLLMTGTPDALSQLSGEIHGSVQAGIVRDSRHIRQEGLGRLRQAPHAGGGGGLPPPARGGGGGRRGGGAARVPGELATRARSCPGEKRALFSRQGPRRSGRRGSLRPSRSGRRASAPGARSIATAMPPPRAAISAASSPGSTAVS